MYHDSHTTPFPSPSPLVYIDPNKRTLFFYIDSDIEVESGVLAPIAAFLASLDALASTLRSTGGSTYSNLRESRVNVTGPSLVRPTLIMAPNFPSGLDTVAFERDLVRSLYCTCIEDIEHYLLSCPVYTSSPFAPGMTDTCPSTFQRPRLGCQ
jgi:hypothetical protein